MEARGGIEPPIMVLQTIALPLGDRATERNEIWSGEGRREKEAFAVQFPALHYRLLPLASVNGSRPATTRIGLASSCGHARLRRANFVDNRSADKVAPFGP